MTDGGARVGRTLSDSMPYWPPSPQPPAGAPNILVVLLDDVDYSDFGCFGCDAETPTIDEQSLDDDAANTQLAQE